MKKVLVAFALIFSVFAAKAQLASEGAVWNEDAGVNHSGVFLNPSIGYVTGDIDSGFGVSLNLGYRWHVGSGFNWDILSVGANSEVSNFTETLDLRFLTGVRYNSPAVLAGKSLYANFGLGYHLLTDNTDIGGFAWEIGAGVNLSSKVSVGIIYEASHYSEDGASANWGLVGARVGFNF